MAITSPATCTKRSYATRWLALRCGRAVRAKQVDAGETRLVTGVYRCASCRDFHLTSARVKNAFLTPL